MRYYLNLQFREKNGKKSIWICSENELDLVLKRIEFLKEKKQKFKYFLEPVESII